jgi:hypothetical protein
VGPLFSTRVAGNETNKEVSEVEKSETKVAKGLIASIVSAVAVRITIGGMAFPGQGNEMVHSTA